MPPGYYEGSNTKKNASPGFGGGSSQTLAASIPSERIEQKILWDSLSRFLETNKNKISQDVADQTSRRLVFMRHFISEAAKQGALEPGKYNLKLEPHEGRAFSSPYKLLNMSDYLRFEVIDTHNGRLVLYGHKSLEATVVKMMRSGGFIFYSPPGEMDFNAALDEAKGLMGHLEARVDLGENAKTSRIKDLSLLISNLETTKEVADSMLHPSSKHSKGDRAKTLMLRKIQEMQGIIDQIKKEEASSAQRTVEGFSNLKIEPTGQYWPIGVKEAYEIASTVKSHKRIGKPKKAGNPKGKKKQPPELHSLFSDFIIGYSPEIISQCRLSPLQQTPQEFARLMKMSVFFSVNRLLKSNLPDSERLMACNDAVNKFSTVLSGMVAKFDAISASIKALESLSPKQIRDDALLRNRAFLHICGLGELRRQLCHDLEAARSLLTFLSSGKGDALSPAIPMLMAHNFAGVSRREALLWEKFLSDMAPIAARHQTEFSSIKSFAALAKSPSIHAKAAGQKMAENITEKNPFKPKPITKNRVSELEGRLFELADSVAKLDDGSKDFQHVSSLLKKVFEDFKSHLLYKFGSWQACSSSLSFYLTAERLLLESGNGPDAWSLLSANAKLFGLFDKYGLSDEVVSSLDAFNHRQPNAHDANSDYDKLIRMKGAGKSFPLSYAYSSSQEHDGGARVAHKATGMRGHLGFTVALPESAVNYSGSGDFFREGFEEIVFGKKQPLKPLMMGLSGGQGSRTVNAKNLYYALFESYISGKADFDRLRGQMNAEGSPEYLASFATPRIINGAVYIGAGGKQYFVDPVRVGDENTLLSGIQGTASPQEAKKQADWYLDRVHARIMFHSANSRKWIWALECARRIAKGE